MSPARMTTILVADDDPVVTKQLELALIKSGFAVLTCPDPGRFLDEAEAALPDLILLDVVFGPRDGRDLCRALRRSAAAKTVPVILMSAVRKGAEDMVEGLKGGADDYLVKPIEPALLSAKIEAVMRRYGAPKELATTLNHYGLSLSVIERKVKAAGKDVSLTRKEFDLLTALLRRPGRVLTARDLLEKVWGYEPGEYDDPNTVHVHISRLRRKLGKSFSDRLTTLVNVGYRLD
ncbi:response regulator transcription factor [bacterium]|nr:MAG: response regulator transcription factor [bacterium]